jgi:outer membrane protein assembly factor BamB
MKRLRVFALALGVAFQVPTSIAQVTTSQYNNLRTGATLTEKILTPQNVNAKQFGKLGAFKVDGAVYAQPLFLPGVEVPGKGTHDVIFVATEHDSVYAFDANRPSDPPLWQVNFLDDARGATIPSEDDVQCPFIRPEVGITSTPAIDRKTGTLYVLARTKIRHTVAADEYFQHLHALAITTGVEKFAGPKLISASVPGKGAGASQGQVVFDPLRENPRASLLLTNDALYLTWASSCDVDPYHGWVMAYDPQTLAQRAVLNVTPDGSEGGIWAADTGPGADAAGNVYIPTGNGTFDAGSGGRDYGDSVLKLGLDGSTLAIRDYFAPHDQERISGADADVGSSGPTLLPDQPGPHRHLLLQPTKDATIYVIDRDNMGKFHRDHDALVEMIKMPGGGYGAMAYWNGHVFFAGSDDHLRDYAIKNGELAFHRSSNMKFQNPGVTPSVSADGNKNAVVWAITTKTWNGPDNRPAVLYAFDATDLTEPIYSSEQNSQRDRAALATRFVFPVVVHGRVYFAARGEVEVYGLLK